MPRTYRVDRRELDKQARNEKKEHPWMGERTARRVARDHLRFHPSYGQAEEVADKIMKREDKKTKPIRKVKPRPYNPMTDGLPRSARRPPF
jgi:hypothetical protein